jgi:N-acetylmuramic acid 6-phosphate etherase
MAQDARMKAEEFLAVARDFQLGQLPTEQRHPETYELAQFARRDLPRALELLKGIDLGVIEKVAAKEKELRRLAEAVRATFASGHRVFFYGCGATGRLSLSIEYVWKFLHRGRPAEMEKVLGFMSGGDLALVHSIENFEDHPEYGARQLREIGFREGDLLVSTTEGGETPSVIGATEEAARLSKNKPFYLYCNPDHVLHEQVERSRRVLENPAIEKICLFVGPMSLSGSTRLQASTALMLGAGQALLESATPANAPRFGDLLAFLRAADLGFLQAFIEEESRIYQEGDFLLYETDEYGITILTDTTERSPTFSLLPFENQLNPQRVPSLSYLSLPETQNSSAAWVALLLREPITLEWDELRAIAGRERLLGFDFSSQARRQRQQLVAPHKLHSFRIFRHGSEMVFELGGLRHALSVAGLHPLFEHLFLKICLNMHSTLVMGRMRRFESNVMTWVKPSNNKLIDRSIRYVEYLLHHHKVLGYSYEDICFQLFEEAATMQPNESVVVRTVKALEERKKGC